MSKFMIECPKCHRYNEASNGLFARRNILCSCGNIINVKNDKIVTRVCPGCGNTVVYDQSEGTKAKCPVCSQQLVADSDRNKMIHFPCHTCGCLLQVSKSATTIRCALCGADNDVQEEVKKAQIRERGEPVTIEYRGDRKTLVWRHPMTEFVLGSQLIVRESQEAIFLRNGEALDSFGPGRHTLETPLLPKLQEKLGAPMSNLPFRAEVYFVNMATQFNQKWGTPSKVQFLDPETNIPFMIGASGGFSMRIVNPRKVLARIVGTQDELQTEQLFDMNNGLFRLQILSRIRARIAQCIQNEGISIFEMDAHLDDIGSAIQTAVNEDLQEYGIELPDFSVVNIVAPEDDPNYRELKAIHAKKVLDIGKAKIAVDVKRVENEGVIVDAETEAAKKRILAKAEADAYGYQASAEAREMQEKGYTYQQETQRQVATAAMENAGGGQMAGGIVSDMMPFGMGINMAKQAAELTREALQDTPAPQAATTPAAPAPAAPAADAWDCACGRKGNTTPFCPACGSAKPAASNTWDCACGRKGNDTPFCPNCGARRPSATWDCACGRKGNDSRFCPSCGRQRS